MLLLDLFEDRNAKSEHRFLREISLNISVKLIFHNFTATNSIDIQSFLKFFQPDGSAAASNMSPVHRRVITILFC